MKLFNKFQSVIALAGLLMSLSVVAFPTAPPGPYQSLEEGLAKSPQPAQQASDVGASDWNWRAPAASPGPDIGIKQPVHFAPVQQVPRHSAPPDPAVISR